MKIRFGDLKKRIREAIGNAWKDEWDRRGHVGKDEEEFEPVDSFDQRAQRDGEPAPKGALGRKKNEN